MEIIFVLLPLSLLLGASGLCAFIWAQRKGQFDDLETPAVKMLLDDDKTTALKANDNEGRRANIGETKH